MSVQFANAKKVFSPAMGHSEPNFWTQVNRRFRFEVDRNCQLCLEEKNRRDRKFDPKRGTQRSAPFPSRLDLMTRFSSQVSIIINSKKLIFNRILLRIDSFFFWWTERMLQQFDLIMMNHVRSKLFSAKQKDLAAIFRLCGSLFSTLNWFVEYARYRMKAKFKRLFSNEVQFLHSFATPFTNCPGLPCN